MGWLIGIDIGGTFTDCIAVGSGGEVISAKVPSTPPKFEEGFHAGLVALAEEAGWSYEDFLGDVEHILHGTTVATNAVVERSGTPVGLITTRGHRDLTLIQKGYGRVAGLPVSELTRPQLTDKPEPLVPRERIVEVDERIDSTGNVVVPLNHEQVREAAEELVAAGCKGIAIGFLWSIRNTSHERKAAEIVASVVPPGTAVITSTDTGRRWGEYERFMAAIISAYLAPVTERYLDEVRDQLARSGAADRALIMQCTGGVVTLPDASRKAAFLIGSGPVGGIVGSNWLSDKRGDRNALCTDMGGTSFDVGMIIDGKPVTRAKAIIGQFEYQVPAIDVHSIGSGGGSIVQVNEVSGTMRVGPRSAGAFPGPAAYGRGGTEPTVTDANVVVGFISPDYFLGGQIVLDRSRSEQAFSPVADALGVSVEEAAAGALNIVENQMAELLHRMSIERGFDPREFTVLAYGGAAPIHATAYARLLGIDEVVIPKANLASVWSALGIATSDSILISEASSLLSEPFDEPQLATHVRGLIDEARAELVRQGWAAADAEIDLSCDLKYSGQLHAIEVPLAVNGGGVEIAAAMEDFEAAYARLYGHGTGYRDAGIALDTLRVRARIPLSKPDLRATGSSSAPVETGKGERNIYWPHLRERRRTPVYDGEAVIDAGASIDGMAIVEFPYTTVVLRESERLEVSTEGDLVVSIDSA